MRASHQKGVYVIIPENACKQPTYLTVHWVQPRRIQNLPILMDGEGVISRILQISPIEVYFLRYLWLISIFLVHIFMINAVL